MRFLKVLLPVLVFGILALAPHPAFAAEATFFGPIIPEECKCVGSAPDFKCVLATMENVINFAISIGVIIFVLVCAYAGFLFMFSSINAENKSKAKNILTNAVVGLLLALAAWLLVDFIMKTLYNEKWGPWNSILGDGGECSPTTGKNCYCLAKNTPPGATGTGDGGDGVTTVTPPDTDITGGFEVGMHVECNKGGQGTYLPAVVNGISEDTGGGNPRVSVCYDGQTRANGGCEDLISADRCRIPSTTGAGIPANGSVTQAGGSCAGNTRACGPNLRCGLQADGANKDKCISTGTATASTFRVGDSVECTRVGTTYSAGTVAAVPNIQLTSSPISVRFASDNATVEITASKCRAQTSATCTAPTVSTGSQIVSSGAVNVLKGILRAACISSATISSGWRDPANQARVMYDNLESRGVADQRALYGSYGDQVIDVYEAQKAAGKTPTEIKSAMEQKIIQVGPGHVSAHSDTAHNTFDVAPTSIPDAKKSAFVSAINAALSAGTIHKRILPPNDPAYHIEVSAPQ